MANKSLLHSSLTDNIFYRSMMAGNAPVSYATGFDLLETTTLTSNASSVSFSGLDAYSDYKHLQLRINGKFSSSVRLQLNGDTGSSYSWHQIYGDGSGALNPQGCIKSEQHNIGGRAGKH